MIDDKDDFGFTFHDESEIEEAKDNAAKAAAFNATITTSQTYKQKLEAVEAIVVPFMQNLMKDPEKVMIRWPNRKEIVEKQLQKILSITKV